MRPFSQVNQVRQRNFPYFDDEYAVYGEQQKRADGQFLSLLDLVAEIGPFRGIVGIVALFQ